jgi:hypothetical protein
MKFNLTCILVLSFFLFSCGEEKKSDPVFRKEMVSLSYGTMENTPVSFQGRLIVISSERVDAHGTRILVRDYVTSSLIASVDTPDFGLVSALVFDGKVFVVGSSDWSVDSTGKSTNTSNTLKMISSSDLTNWTAQQMIYQAPSGVALFNTSFSYDGGRFVLAYEVKNSSNTGFDIYFLASNDLMTWFSVGDGFDDSRYAACPTIRFLNGYYYMFYLSVVSGKYQMMLSRSQDLISWEHATTTDFSPSSDEGVNNSDVDFVEKEGQTYFIYATGDQQTWLGVRRASYTGSFESYVDRFQYTAVRP